MPPAPGKKLLDRYTSIVSSLQEISDDVAKASGGNGAAGTRIRKVIGQARKDLMNLKKISLGKEV